MILDLVAYLCVEYPIENDVTYSFTVNFQSIVRDYEHKLFSESAYHTIEEALEKIEKIDSFNLTIHFTNNGDKKLSASKCYHYEWVFWASDPDQLHISFDMSSPYVSFNESQFVEYFNKMHSFDFHPTVKNIKTFIPKLIDLSNLLIRQHFAIIKQLKSISRSIK
ncbi:MAG: hypothetical protein WC389_19180 [Lutibacter sp.]